MSGKVIIFESQLEAQAVLDVIHVIAASYFASNGFIVRQDAASPSGLVVVDKRPDGSDSPSGHGMACWSPVLAAPDGRWYIPDPNGFVPDLMSWRTMIGYQETDLPAVDFPTEWAIDVDM